MAAGTHVHVFASSDQDVTCRTSPDRGQTWNAPVTVCTGTSGQLIASQAGSFLAVLVNHVASGDLAYSISVDTGATWTTTALLDGSRIAMHIDSARVHVLTREGSNLWLQSSADYGRHWLPRVLVLPGMAWQPDAWRFHADGDVVLLCYVDPVARGTWIKRSTDGGGSFPSSATQLTSGSSLLDLDRDGGVIYVAAGGYRTRVELLHSTDRGATWTTHASPIVSDSFRISAANGSVALIGQDLEFCPMTTTQFHAAITSDRGATWNAAHLTLDATCSLGQEWHRNWEMHFRPPTLVFHASSSLCSPGLPRLCTARPMQTWATTNMGRTWNEQAHSVSTHAPGTSHLAPIREGLALIVQAPWLYSLYGALLYGSQTYGVGAPGSSGIAPMLQNAAGALLGHRIAPSIDRAIGGAPVCFAVSLSGATRIPLGAGEWLVQGPLTVIGGITSGPSGSSGVGTLAFPFTLPVEPSARGTSLNFQALVLDAGAIDGFSLTNGLEVWLQ
ncbi:MAG: hypothetical protein JNM84_10235 [Planctomycetes bacterium]|nr:hypothetical protein [Planctomycetota bacterium]